MSEKIDVFAKTQDLKRRFAEFPELAALIEKINQDVKGINDANTKVGGDDEIGKQYHSQVDQATKDLDDLIKKIKETVDKAGENGINLVAELDYAEDSAHDIMNSL
ncbi:hypothetical protein P3T27_005482 [Kitasatospora sp. MAA19]|uniref:hypothetical protein n=1 Tax=unclassified Kitasatospora TaxID=2633591 RepID=UPI00247491E3|nr:hypothetical protein [Kitasatospora sp. MAA19]MDH6708736.1 hypothetical protein [Kitasatospora sp. MAA19]